MRLTVQPKFKPVRGTAGRESESESLPIFRVTWKAKDEDGKDQAREESGSFTVFRGGYCLAWSESDRCAEAPSRALFSWCLDARIFDSCRKTSRFAFSPSARSSPQSSSERTGSSRNPIGSLLPQRKNEPAPGRRKDFALLRAAASSLARDCPTAPRTSRQASNPLRGKRRRLCSQPTEDMLRRL